MKAQAALIVPSCKQLPTMGLMKGFMGCAAFLTVALLILSTSSQLNLFQGPLAPKLLTLIGMLPPAALDAAAAPPLAINSTAQVLEAINSTQVLVANNSTQANAEEEDIDEGNVSEYESRIRRVLDKACMRNRTVILTTLNGAWANDNTMINLFLESFWVGYGTQRLLRHLIFICVDEEAYERCQLIHPHCLQIKTHDVNLAQEQLLLSANYIKLVWRRIKFMKTLVEMNYNFIFTDTDVLWLRDPLPFLERNTDPDIQLSADSYNKVPWDMRNKPNTGFMYVRANERSLKFLRYWYEERTRDASLATQGILNIIKFEEPFMKIGVKFHFLDPQFFGGFCRIRYNNMVRTFTLHATCCKGLEAKLHDLRMILDGWKKWQQLNQHYSTSLSPPFKKLKGRVPPPISPQFVVPYACVRSMKVNSNTTQI